MSVRSKNLKLVGVGGAAALVVGAVAAPALAAGTASVNYTCTITGVGSATPSALYNVASAPATMVVGQPLSTTATITLDAGTTALAQAQGWAKIKGTIATKPSASKAGLALKLPKTPVNQTPGGTTDLSGKGSTLAGTKVGDFAFKLGDLGLVKLTGYSASGQKLNTVKFPDGGNFQPCTNNDGTTPIMDGATAMTTKLVKDASTTTVHAKYLATKKATRAKAHVSGKLGHLPGTGTVRFFLMKGTNTVAKASGKLNKKGIAHVTIKKALASGKYKMKAKYGGDARLKASTGTARFKA